jgi:tetratricopeptide (TPR) repeat protein
MLNRKEKLLEMLSQSPEDEFLNYAVAMEFKSELNLTQSILFFENCIKINPNHTAAMYQLALIFEEKGEISKVLEILDRGISILKSTNDRKTLNEFISLRDMNMDF